MDWEVEVHILILFPSIMPAFMTYNFILFQLKLEEQCLQVSSFICRSVLSSMNPHLLQWLLKYCLDIFAVNFTVVQKLKTLLKRKNLGGVRALWQVKL